MITVKLINLINYVKKIVATFVSPPVQDMFKPGAPLDFSGYKQLEEVIKGASKLIVFSS